MRKRPPQRYAGNSIGLPLQRLDPCSPASSMSVATTRHFWPPICLRTIEVQTGSHLLMHEGEMLFLPQTLVHLPPLERPVQKGVAPVGAYKQLLRVVSTL